MANSPWRDTYDALGDLRVGLAAWHLDLTPARWAADGLLAIFALLGRIRYTGTHGPRLH